MKQKRIQQDSDIASLKSHLGLLDVVGTNITESIQDLQESDTYSNGCYEDEPQLHRDFMHVFNSALEIRVSITDLRAACDKADAKECVNKIKLGASEILEDLTNLQLMQRELRQAIRQRQSDKHQEWGTCFVQMQEAVEQLHIDAQDLFCQNISVREELAKMKRDRDELSEELKHMYSMMNSVLKESDPNKQPAQTPEKNASALNRKASILNSRRSYGGALRLFSGSQKAPQKEQISRPMSLANQWNESPTLRSPDLRIQRGGAKSPSYIPRLLKSNHSRSKTK